MDNIYFEYGELINELSADSLTIDSAKRTYYICLSHLAFKVIELRRIESEKKEIIIVDCTNDEIPTKNTVGIQYTERLALVFSINNMPDVKTLRKTFPRILHQNHTPINQPISLCLHEESWQLLDRQWTPQKYLKRIVWWLTKAATETLHNEAQAVEPLFFKSGYELVLPDDFIEKSKNKDLIFRLSSGVSRENGATITGNFVPKNSPKTPAQNFDSLIVDIPPIVHGHINISQFTKLGELNDLFEDRDVSLIDLIRVEIKSIATTGLVAGEKVLLILNIPMLRSKDGAIERIDTRCFLLDADLVKLGRACEVLDTRDKYNKYYPIVLLNGSFISDEWRTIEVGLIDKISHFSTEMAQYIAGIEPLHADFSGLLIGVGALGSHMLEIWVREAWGQWTIIDGDYFKPHNIARHICMTPDIGDYKVKVIKFLLENIYPLGTVTIKPTPQAFRDVTDTFIENDLKTADLIVDVSTTLEVPRDLSTVKYIKRAVSTFLTPSGHGAVLLFEDQEKEINLASLEAQYYRAIFTNAWGENHLLNHIGHLKFGGGCRDISFNISVEFVKLFAATLARQVRLHAQQQNALIQVWHVDPDSGAIETTIINPALSIEVKQNDWTIIWDFQLRDKVRAIRHSSLPNETGGIILGYVDHKIKTIFIVDLLLAPTDSHSDLTGFTIGTQGISETVEAAKRKTAYVVEYVGEWHSHPMGTSSQPSKLDYNLLNDRAKILQEEGCPAVILIVAENDDRWLLKENKYE